MCIQYNIKNVTDFDTIVAFKVMEKIPQGKFKPLEFKPVFCSGRISDNRGFKIGETYIANGVNHPESEGIRKHAAGFHATLDLERAKQLRDNIFRLNYACGMKKENIVVVVVRLSGHLMQGDGSVNVHNDELAGQVRGDTMQIVTMLPN